MGTEDSGVQWSLALGSEMAQILALQEATEPASGFLHMLGLQIRGVLGGYVVFGNSAKQTEHCYIHSQEPECQGSPPWMFHLQCADENVFPSVSCGLHLFMFLPCSASLPSHLSNGSNLRAKAMERCMSDMNLLPGLRETHVKSDEISKIPAES